METGAINSSAEFRDKTYDLDQSRECHLNVLVDRDAICYSITEIDSATVRALYRFAGTGNPLDSQWKESLKDIGDFQQEYRSATVAVNAVPFFLFPDTLDQAVDKAEMYEANFGMPPLALRTHQIGESKIHIGFELPHEFDEEFHRRQPYAKVVNSSGLMIQSILKRHRFSKGFTAYVNVGETYVDCYVLKDNDLALYNWFPVKTKNDILYHILNVATQLNFDPAITPLHVTGMIDIGDTTYELLKSYLPKMSPIYTLDHVKLSLGLHGVKKQNYSALFNLFACV